MAKCDLNGITLDEVKSNSTNVYAANIVSGEIFKVACRHSKNGNIVLSIEGKALTCKSFNGDTFVVDGCFLYNPPLTKMLVEACDDSNDSIYIIKGVVTKTAPAPSSKPSSDTVLSKEDLMKELTEIKSNFSNLKGQEKVAAFLRMDEIETALKTA